LAQGLPPPDLLRKAVMQDFVAAEVAARAHQGPRLVLSWPAFYGDVEKMGLLGQVVFLWRHGLAHGIHLGASHDPRKELSNAQTNPAIR
jgi:hypothetical protein